jgi:uncharacterized protein YuzE
MEQKIINSTKIAVDDLVKLALIGNSKLNVDYDKEVDVLYINFGKPKKADDAIQDKNGIIRRKRKGEIVGLTILNASRFSKSK